MTLGDGHDLTSARFSRLLELEADFDDESVSAAGSKGREVQAIQHALYDVGHSLPEFGADGDFGRETTVAVEDYQTAHPPLTVDGKVGFDTVGSLDVLFPTPALLAADLSAGWTIRAVRGIIRPWSPRTIDVLVSRITLKSFDTIEWVDEEWDGTAWVSAPFPGGGYHEGDEIGVLNGSNELIAETLYHEVLHAEQPTSHTSTIASESYAYRISEEFSIALGLTGRPTLRSTDVQGREFADRARVDAFVRVRYPSVVAGSGDEILGKGVATGTVRVQKPDGTIVVRAAAVGEKVPGPIRLANEVTHAATDWTAP